MTVIEKNRWLVLSPLLDELLDAAPATRDARLAQIVTQDPGLGAELADLLAQHAQIETAQFLEGNPFLVPPEITLAGQAVGSYTLEAEIGQGGMGSVWRARRSDGRYEGHAAVKFLNLGLFAAGGLERFKREGSVLARLAHPHIARLLDAGVHAGQPYLVLEYIDGQPIDRWCDAQRLGVTARVKLFLDVLGAVAHAHNNLILHRDLKPSNILVTAEGGVRLLDFGIAKLLDEPPADGTAAAATQAFTPDYAAPEQLQGTDVSTATDVYALGVLLYNLLAGIHPTADGCKTRVDVLRALVDKEPARASDAAARASYDVAHARGAAPAQLARALRGDLDNILAKALKKKPAERYATVDALAADLHRYLRHEPVSARPDSLWYRAGKFVRRYRLAVAAGSLTMVALVAGVAGTTWQAREAQSQRDRAVRQLQRAEAANRLIALLLSETSPDGRPFTPAELLARGEVWAGKLFANEPRLHAEMLLVLGDRYGDASDDARALDLYEHAYRQARTVTGAPDLRARAACRLGMALAQQGKQHLADAQQRVEEGLAELRGAGADAGEEAECLASAAYVASMGGADAEAVKAAERAVALVDAHPEHLDDSMQAVVAVLASMYTRAGRYGEAAPLHDRAVRLMEKAGMGDTVRMSLTLNNAAHNLFAAGAPLEAARLFERAIAIDRRAGIESGHRSNLANALIQMGRAREAAEMHLAEAAAVDVRRSPIERARSLVGAANALRVAGDVAGARARFDEVGALLKGNLPAGHVAHAAVASMEARLLAAEGRLDAALDVARAAEVRFAATGPRSSDRAMNFADMAGIELALRRPEDALASAEQAVKLARQAATGFPYSFRVGVAELERCRALIALNRAAQPACAEAVANLKPAIGEDAPTTRAAQAELARATAG